MHNIFTYAADFQKQHPLYLDGFGGSMPEGVFLKLSASFTVIEKLRMEKARALLIESIDNFLLGVNGDLILKAHLDHYPFDYNDVDISLGFLDEGGEFVTGGYIAHAFIKKGKLYYSTYNATTGRLEDFGEEPYLEAREKVMKQ